MHDHDARVHTGLREGTSHGPMDTIVDDEDGHMTPPGDPGDASDLYTREQVQEVVDAAYEQAVGIINNAACYAYSLNERSVRRRLERVMMSVKALMGRMPG